MNASTATPRTFVTPIPLITLAPTFTSAAYALASRPRSLVRSKIAGLGTAYARAICAQNSTLMPTQMIRLTNETAFNETEHSAMVPRMAMRVLATVAVTASPVATLPSSSDETSRTKPRAPPRRAAERRAMERYWSKKM